jgi:ankyrin repeat protein
MSTKMARKRLMLAFAWDTLRDHPNDIDVNVVRHHISGWNPLHYAVYYKDVELIKYLIEVRNADVNIKSDSGCIPLMIAAHAGQLDLCQILIDNGADVNIKDDTGQTALHYAAEDNYSRVCLYLIHLGANVNECDNFGNHPFRCCYYYGYFDLFKWFCYYGAMMSVFEEEEIIFDHRATNEKRIELLNYVAKQSLRQIILSFISVKMVQRLGKNSMVKVLNVDAIRELFEMLDVEHVVEYVDMEY